MCETVRQVADCCVSQGMKRHLGEGRWIARGGAFSAICLSCSGTNPLGLFASDAGVTGVTTEAGLSASDGSAPADSAAPGSNCSDDSPDVSGCPCQAGASHACYTGPLATRGVAPCQDGTQACNAGVFGACAGEVVPSGTANISCTNTLPPPDAGPPPMDGGQTMSGDGGLASGCTQAATLVYVIDDQGVLHSFDPGSLTFETIGTVDCGSGPVQAESLAIDRGATAWVLDTSGNLYTVSTKTAKCKTTTFTPVEGYTTGTGMAFSSDVANGVEDTLWVCGTDLAKIDRAAMTLKPVAALGGSVPAGTQCELTGTILAQLYGFFDMPPASFGLINKADASVPALTPLTGLNAGDDFAFSFWSGRFYFYTAEPSTSTSTSNVTVYDPTTGSTTVVLSQIGFRIVGAGASTCASH